MTTYQMNLQLKHFNFIKYGTKRIELRLYDEKRRKLQLSDVIEFATDAGEKIRARIIGLLRYQSFAELMADFDITILADKTMTKEELLRDLLEFYSLEEQARFGVVGIRLELME